MQRADRSNNSRDNEIKHPKSRQVESTSAHELKTLLLTARSQRDEWQQRSQEKQTQAEQNYTLYLEEQHKHQNALTLYQEVQTQAQSYLTLYDAEKSRNAEVWVKYEEVQTQAQSYLTLYNSETAKNADLLVKYEEAQTQREHYLTLYNEAQSQLKLERRSKAGIKSWETRRKRENERLKQEIAAMTIVLRDSLAGKEDAVNNLYALADRMDRIQQLVDSVEEEPTNSPMGVIQKFKRIWQVIKEILEE
ncbi:hypothetical protein IFO70_32545 [Phormidium tenue FACHB-886]|nr:hypothetical protein [Phormidium tenue FACHB-886]